MHNLSIYMKYEVLAPSGDFESLKAAINSNAQAVYLGLSDFNARRSAVNFNKDNIREAVELAHLYNVKVYITLNTIIKNSEYSRLIETIKYAIDAKVDAFIVQDLGVARVLKNNFKGIVMHASTQMGVNNLYSAKVIEKLGFSRVTLARETRLEDIKLIKENTNLEIEYFVQGALCISYSGNCYLSSFLLGESGNRGRCKQLCRYEYSVNNSKDKKYYLSARDQSLIYEMKRLMDAGVNSFKIEGRMRHPGYVATATTAYNSIIKSIEENKDIDYKLIEHNLMEAFSRGKYIHHSYLDDNTPNNIVNTSFQNHHGVRIGKVINSRKFKDIYEILIESNHNLSSGDGLKIIKDDKEICSLGVGNINVLGNNRYIVYSKHYLEKNSDIYLILNSKRESELLNNIRKIDIKCSIKAKENEPLSISFSKDNVSINYESDFILEHASNHPATDEDIKSSIDRLNDDRFNLSNITIDKDDVFIPKSVINNARRIAFSNFKDKLIEYNEKDIKYEYINDKLDTKIPNFKYNKTLVIFDDKSIDLLKPNESITYIYSPQSYTLDNIINVFEKLKEKGINDFGLNQPLISLTKDLKLIDELFNRYSDLLLLGNNISCLYYSLNNKKVIPSHNLNIFSTISINAYSEFDVENIVLSIETNREIYNELNNVYAYKIGYNTLMNFAHCPYKTVNNNTCENCSYDSRLSIDKMNLRRYVQSLCAFEMLSNNPINISNEINNLSLVDIREFSNDEKKMIIDSLINNKKIVLKNESLGLIDKEIK